MGEPTRLSPREIDQLTLAQLALYFKDPQRSLSYEEVCQRVREFRRQKAMEQR